MDDDRDTAATTNDLILGLHQRLRRIEIYLVWVLIFLAGLVGDLVF